MHLRRHPYRLMAPGPVQIPSTVLEQLAQPMIHHRTPEFTAILSRVLTKLKVPFATQQPVMMITGTGSAGMEAAIVNTLSPGDTIIAIVAGKFGERWAAMAKSYGMNVVEIAVPWGQAVTVREVETALEQHPQCRAVLVQACETSTATEQPIEALAHLVRSRPQTLLLVDAITAIGTMPLPMNEWGLDVVVAGSQKAFMIPTGLAFIALSEKAWEATRTARCPKYYFDLPSERKANEKNDTRFSAAVSHVRALDVALDAFLDGGLARLISRSGLLSASFRKACQTAGLAPFGSAPARAVTAISVPDGVDGVTLRDRIEKDFNITVMGGQDQLKGRIIRIGHLGAITDEDHIATFEALGDTLKAMNWSGFQDRRWQEAKAGLRDDLAAG